MIINGDAQLNDHVVRVDYAHARFGYESARPAAGWYGSFKVFLEIALAIALLVIAAPIMLLTCLAVKLTSRGPAFYCQTRLGRGGIPYRMYKIRTMTQNCEMQSGACWAKPNDPRITPVGRFLRRTHLDELPQLWNVLRGEMSLVGPRPERPEFVGKLTQALPRYRERLHVRPGVTGLAQVQLPADTDLDSVRRKLAYDVYYVEKHSLWLDCRILLATVVHVLGLPCSLSRLMFSIPGGEPLELAFCDVPMQTAHLPELNPA